VVHKNYSSKKGNKLIMTYEQELYSKFLHSIFSHDNLNNYPLIGNARVAFCSGGKVLMEAPCAYKVEEHYICMSASGLGEKKEKKN